VSEEFFRGGPNENNARLDPINPRAQPERPSSGEPHHHLKIENEYVRVYYVEVPPHENTQLHQHDNDYIFIALGAADIINAPLNKPELHQVLKDGEIHFARGGFAHVARNLADTPFRNITIEFLKPQGEVRNLCERIIDGPLNDCTSSSANSGTIPADSPLRAFIQATGPKRLFETEEIFVTSHFSPIEQKYSETGPPAGRLLIVEDDSELRVDVAGESPKSLQAGEVFWLNGGKKWTIVTPGQHKTTRFLLVRFKGSETANKSQ
jgi:beta-alanine degradation protein BauB